MLDSFRHSLKPTRHNRVTPREERENSWQPMKEERSPVEGCALGLFADPTGGFGETQFLQPTAKLIFAENLLETGCEVTDEK